MFVLGYRFRQDRGQLRSCAVLRRNCVRCCRQLGRVRAAEQQGDPSRPARDMGTEQAETGAFYLSPSMTEDSNPSIEYVVSVVCRQTRWLRPSLYLG